MQCIPIDLGRWFDFFSGFKVCAWCERRFELHTIWARMNVYESVQMCIYERVGVPGWPVSRTQQLCYRYPPSTESTPLLVDQLIWSELLALRIWLSYPALASGHFNHAGIDWLDRQTASDTSKERPWCWGFKHYFSVWSNPHIVDVEVEDGVDFRQAKRDPESGKLCVLEEKEVDTLLKKPILECTHRSENRSMNILFELAYLCCMWIGKQQFFYQNRLFLAMCKKPWNKAD